MDKQVFFLGLAMAAVAGIATVPLAVAVQNSTNDVLQVLQKVTSETVSTLDRAWDIALKFRDPNYVYDPHELMQAAAGLNSTIASIDFSNSTAPG